MFRFPLIHRLLLKTFLPPWLASFSVVLFVLVLQFLGRYQDAIFGKGFGPDIIAQLFFYAAVQLVVLALPISLLMASLMTFGRLGENYELAALKSAGIPLWRTMAPIVVVGFGLMGVAFLFSSFLVPQANLKLYALLYDIRQAKPAFALKPGLFNNLIEGYTIYVRDRSAEGRLYDIKIYDHTQGRGVADVILADSGDMQVDNRLLYLRLQLYHGSRYEEIADNKQGEKVENPKHAMARMYFDTLRYNLDISGFGLKRTNENSFTNHYYMQSLPQLRQTVDSLWNYRQRTRNHLQRALPFWSAARSRLDSAGPGQRFDTSGAWAQQPPHCYFSDLNQRDVQQKKLARLRNLQTHLEQSVRQLDYRDREARRYASEYHSRWAMSAACLLFVLIGAPLGAIIRKGGLGMPVVVSLGFFVLFYALLTNGRKLAREGATPVMLGIWLANLVLFPLALTVLWQAVMDSALLDLNVWRMRLGQLLHKLGLRGR